MEQDMRSRSFRLGLTAAALMLTGGARADDNWLTRQFAVDEQGWLFNFSYYYPTHLNRPMDFYSLEAARTWKLALGLELQLRGGMGHTAGSRADDPADGESRDSTTTGITGGVGFRYHFLDIDRVHAFGDALLEFYWAQGQPFPSGGTAIDGFLRAGGGIGYDISPRYAIEATWHYAHISNGGKPPQNPTWEGQGYGIALRYRL